MTSQHDTKLVVSVLEDLEAPFEPRTRYVVKVNGEVVGHVHICETGWFGVPVEARVDRGREVWKSRTKAVFDLLRREAPEELLDD